MDLNEESALFDALEHFGKSFVVFTLDVSGEFQPDLEMCFKEWRFWEWDQRSVNRIWAGPPCTEYSMAKTIGVRKLDWADSLVERLLQCNEWFYNSIYFVENPYDGQFAMRRRPCMQSAPGLVHKTSYCRWDRPFRKNTMIYSNIPLDMPVCNHQSHEQAAQGGPSNGKPGVGNTHKYLHPVPDGLLDTCFRAANML